MRGRPLDPVPPTNEDARPTAPAGSAAPGTAPGGPGTAGTPGGAAGAGRPPEPPPGLKTQVGNTKDALVALARAHVDLAKAEATEIGDEAKIVAAGVAAAIGALILVAFLVPIGIILFLGEWLFGSMGWGVLHGTEALVLVGVAAVLGALETGRIPRAIALGVVAGALVATLFGTNAPNLLYRLIADQLGTAPDPGPIALLVGAAVGAVVLGLLGAISGARSGSLGGGLVGGLFLGAAAGALVGGLVRLAVNVDSRPMVVGIVIVGVLVGLVGLVIGARSDGIGGALTGLVAGIVLGGAAGAFTAITFTWHVAIAIGVALALGLALGLLVADAATTGIDQERLKQRFYPGKTIETAKETLEWAKARIPRGPAS